MKMIAFFFAAGALAQHMPDPFHGTNCTCTDYCSGTCAINTTDGNYKHEMSLYRYGLRVSEHMLTLSSAMQDDSVCGANADKQEHWRRKG